MATFKELYYLITESEFVNKGIRVNAARQNREKTKRPLNAYASKNQNEINKRVDAYQSKINNEQYNLEVDISRLHTARRDSEYTIKHDHAEWRKDVEDAVRKNEAARKNINSKKGGIIAAISIFTTLAAAAKIAYNKTDKAKLKALKKETQEVQNSLKAGEITEEQATTKLKSIQERINTIINRSKKEKNDNE